MATVPLSFTLIISKLDNSQDIYNLMHCNSAMKNVFFDNIGNEHLRLIMDFAFPLNRQFQKNLTNSEYYTLLQHNSSTLSPWGLKIKAYNEERIAFNFRMNNQGLVWGEMITTVNGKRIIPGSPIKIKYKRDLKILWFLLLNKIDVNPSKKEIFTSHMQWMLDHGFIYTPALREEILATFDLSKIQFILNQRFNFDLGYNILTDEQVSTLFKGPQSENSLVQPLPLKEQQELIEFLLKGPDNIIPPDILILKSILPKDFLMNGDYVDFSYDIINSSYPKLFNNIMQEITESKDILHNLVPIIKWMIAKKKKISRQDVTDIYHMNIYGESIPAGEAFMYLLENKYFPTKNTFTTILTNEPEDIWNLMRDKGADFTKLNLVSIGRGMADQVAIRNKATKWLSWNKFI